MYTVSTTALYVKRSYPDGLGKYSPGHCNPVPTIRVVGHSTYDATLITNTQATCLLLKYEGVVGIQTVSTTPYIDKYWRFTRVTFTDSRYDTEKWPLLVQVYCSHEVANNEMFVRRQSLQRACRSTG
jgi:hypothetical protein